MLAKSLIKLIKECKIDEKTPIFEVYFRLFIRNLSFCTDAKPTDEPAADDQIHFLRFLKLFQMQVSVPQLFPMDNPASSCFRFRVAMTTQLYKDLFYLWKMSANALRLTNSAKPCKFLLSSSKN